jgi:hypothetical protein
MTMRSLRGSAAPTAPATWPTTTRTAAAAHVGYLTAISVGRHSGYDRVAFTFSEGIPGYAVGYVNQVRSDPMLLQARAAGDFESYLSFGIGLNQRTGFRVFTLTQPYRVVIDVAHRS